MLRIVTDVIIYLKIKTELGETILDLALPRPLRDITPYRRLLSVARSPVKSYTASL
jgi:hypothetical protein